MNAAHHLRIAPTVEKILREDITAICNQIDVRLGNRPGTAERGLYFWLWPPGPNTDANVLTDLHSDAVVTLAAIVMTGAP